MFSNDDGKKMVEGMALEPFLDEYKHVTGVEMTVLSPSERPDFICQRRRVQVGLELVRARAGRGEESDGLDAAIRVQEAVYAKEQKRASAGWQYPNRTILVVQLIRDDGESAAEYLDDQLMEEMSETGFCEIWIADYSPMESHGTVQLVGIKPKGWRGPHPHRAYETKPYG